MSISPQSGARGLERLACIDFKAERCEKYQLYERKFQKYFVGSGSLNNFFLNI